MSMFHRNYYLQNYLDDYVLSRPSDRMAPVAGSDWMANRASFSENHSHLGKHSLRRAVVGSLPRPHQYTQYEYRREMRPLKAG
jgi:hypothetical protein